jgi:hypothetical protein
VVESLINISWNDGDLKVGEAKDVNRKGYATRSNQQGRDW